MGRTPTQTTATATRSHLPLGPRGWTLAATVAVLIALAGCGGSSSSTASQPAKQASVQTPTTSSTNAPPATSKTSTSTPVSSKATAGTHKPEAHAPTFEKVELSSPVVGSEGLLPVRYGCGGQDTPIPLRWKGIPSGTKELMLDVIKISPVDNKLVFAWALSGLKASSHGITGGSLPAGTVVGANSTGRSAYHLCPPKGPAEKYVAVLFALPHRLPASPGFDAAKLRLQALHDARYEGFLLFSYQH
jgi:phosphatidylethanolamine-binding protein (PEBP) family uncharacterized protein